MKIHFSGELEVKLFKASGGCGVRGSAAIVGMLRPTMMSELWEQPPGQRSRV